MKSSKPKKLIKQTLIIAIKPLSFKNPTLAAPTPILALVLFTNTSL